MLPSMGSEYATGDPNAVGGVGMGGGHGKGRRKRGLVRAGMDWVGGLFGGLGEGVGWSGDKRSF